MRAMNKIALGKRFKKLFDERFEPHWINYVLQSLLASFAIFIVLIALHDLNLAVAASLAATAFTVFMMPGSIVASTRNVVGGQVIGLVFGSLFALLVHEPGLVQDLLCALAVGSSMFVMSITNTEHPPAAGTALGVAVAGFSFKLVLGILLGVIILSIIHRLLRHKLRDLIAVSECYPKIPRD